MFDINEFVSGVLEEIGGLAVDTFGGYVEEVKKDGKEFLEASKTKLKKWGEMYTEGGFSKEDLTDLVKGQQDLLEMAALTQAGVAAIELEKFRDGIIKIIIEKIIK